MVLLALGYRRGVFGATPAGARYGFRLKCPPQNRNTNSWLLAIFVGAAANFAASGGAWCAGGAAGKLSPDVCSDRNPVSVIGNGALDSGCKFTLRHATSVTLNTCNALPTSSRTHQFLFARPPPCVLLMCVVYRGVVLVQLCCFSRVLHVASCWCCALLAVMLVCCCAGRVVGGNRSGGDV